MHGDLILSTMPEKKFPHDAIYKTLFSYPEIVKSLLLDFVPEDFVRKFDFSTLEPCKNSFVGPDFKQRHDDIIWRVKWAGKDCYICLMLEFQSSQDLDMALRIYTYTALLLSDVKKRKPAQFNGKLPAVFPIVLYNGEKPWKAPLNIIDLIEPLHTRLIPYQPSQQYLLIDEKRIPKEVIDAAKGDAKYIIEAEQADSGDSIYQIAVDFSEDHTGKDTLRRDIFQWLAFRIRKVDPDWLNNIAYGIYKSGEGNMLADVIDMHLKKIDAQKQQYIDEGIEQGVKQGMEQGIKQGIYGILIEMLNERFEEVPPEWIERISNLSDMAVLKNLTKSVWKVESAADFEIMLKNSELEK